MDLTAVALNPDNFDLDSLPPEIIYEVCNQMPFEDLQNMVKTSRRVREICDRVLKSKHFVYLIFANVAENELIHFYIPEELITAEEKNIIKRVAKVFFTRNEYLPHREEINRILRRYWKYIRDGPQTLPINQTYCIDIRRDNN